jgi:PST family polysaccharide transporter
VAAVAEPLTLLLFGDKWGPAAPVLALLSLLMPVKTLNNFLGTATSAAGHPGVRLCSQLLILTLTLAAVGLGFSGGLERVMTLLLAAHYLVLPLLLFNYCRVLPVTPGQTAASIGRHLVTALAAFVLCLLAQATLQVPLEMILLLNCFIFAAGYLGLALVFSRQDLLRLVSLLRHRGQH